MSFFSEYGFNSAATNPNPGPSFWEEFCTGVRESVKGLKKSFSELVDKASKSWEAFKSNLSKNEAYVQSGAKVAEKRKIGYSSLREEIQERIGKIMYVGELPNPEMSPSLVASISQYFPGRSDEVYEACTGHKGEKFDVDQILKG